MQTQHFTTKDAPKVLDLQPGTENLVVEENMTPPPILPSGLPKETESREATMSHAAEQQASSGDRWGGHATTVHVRQGSTLIYSFNAVPQNNLVRSITLEMDDGANATFYGIVFGEGSHELRLNLKEVHARGASVGKTVVRSIMADQSTFHLNGLIDIRPEANHSDARLEGRSVLLSKDARSTLIPSLEIAARDVKASHAAATGPIDPEQLFYLMSRGMSFAEARALILHGFLQGVLSRLPTDPATEALTMKWETFLTRLYATPPSLV